MKKYAYSLLIALMVCTLIGCGEKMTETEPPQETSAETHLQVCTETEILSMFDEYAEPGWTVIDCVTVSGSAYGVIGVVQYTTEDYDGCMFDFIQGGTPMRMGVGAPSAGKGTLEYVGEDTVSCRLIGSDGEPYTCTISFVSNGNEVSFKVVG